MWILNSGPMQRRFSDTSNCRKSNFSESLNFSSFDFCKKIATNTKKTLPHTNLITPMLPLSLLSLPFSLVGSTLDFIFKKPACILYFINLNYYSSLSVIGLISHPIGILYLAPVMLGRSTTHEAITVEKRMPLDDWQHQWFAIA